MRIALGILAVVAYFALVWFFAIRRERNAKRDAAAVERSMPSTIRQPVSFRQPAAKGFSRGDAA